MSYTETLMPVSDGSWLALTPVPAAPPTHYDKVIESDDGKYNYWASAVSGDDTYVMSTPVKSGTIENIRVYLDIGCNSALLSRKYIIYAGGNYYESGHEVTSPGIVYIDYANHPATSLPWEMTDIESNFQVGLGLIHTGVPSGCWIDKLWVVVTYTSAPSRSKVYIIG